MLASKRTYGRHRDVTPQGSDDEATTPPTSQHSASNILTPKSKIAAMLADLDKEDDETRLTTGMTQRSPSSTTSDSRTGSAQRLGRSRVLPSVAQIMQKDSDDDEEEDEEDGGTAYERLRKRLLTSSRPQIATAVHHADDGKPTDSADGSDIELPDTAAAIKASVEATTPRDNIRRLAEKKRLLAQDEAEKVEEVARAVSPAPETASICSNEIAAKLRTTSESDSEDIEAEIRMSSAKRAPRRAATKKALEEMHRETERIARNMTLAPSAQVKTKLKINDFLSKIGYIKAIKKPDEEPPQSLPDDTETASAKTLVPADDDPFVVDELAHNPQVNPQGLPLSEAFAAGLEESDSDIELPAVSEIVASQDIIDNQKDASETLVSTAREDILLDSDTDSNAESLPDRLKSHQLLFKRRDFGQINRDRQVAKFVAMARPDSPTKQEARAEKARRNALLAQVGKQAKIEREAREAVLRAAGIEIKSSEQRQKEALQVDDLVEKARRQAVELRKLEEREDRKKKAAEQGVNDDSSEEDDDWQADAEDSGNESDRDSQSDVEDEATDVDEEVEHTGITKPVLDRTSSILSERRLSEDDDISAPVVRRILAQKKHARRVFEDDSEEDKENATPINMPESLGSGLTQFFEPTQAVEDMLPDRELSATQILAESKRQESHDMRALRDNINDEDFRGKHLGKSLLEIDSPERPDFVPSSQPDVAYREPKYNATQISLFDPPSPDGSIQILPATLQPDLTQATQVDSTQKWHDATQIEEEAPGRLRRGINSNPSTTSSSGPINAFKRMRQAMNEEEHQKSRRAFVDDRAVESDDEYAGLGGVSDDEPENAEEIAAELADMIDHDAQDDDEEGQRQIAAYYAQQDLENDEKMVNNLMNDINNGGLRKRRGAGLLDMDDSEDEEEEKARYRARQAQMRARLLESQNLTSLADNPKTKAFIEALEDKQENASFIEIAGEEDMFDTIPETQPEAETSTMGVPSLQHTDTQVDEPDSQQNAQMAPPLRPVKKSTKRKTLNDIRQELSFLNDDDENESQSTIEFDPAFVPSLKRERSSMNIEDRSTLSRENSQTWHDPRSGARSETSMYSQLASARSAENMALRDPVNVVVSKGHQMASRMATRAVNYHAKAAQQMRAGREKRLAQRQQPKAKNGARDTDSKSKKQAVLKLFA